MPSKERRRRELARAEAEREATLVLGPSVPENERLPNPFQAATQLPWGLVKIDPDDGELYLDERTGRGGNLIRKDNKDIKIDSLRITYSEIWGKRGAAKRIAIETGLSERTVQRYFQATK